MTTYYWKFRSRTLECGRIEEFTQAVVIIRRGIGTKKKKTNQLFSL
jgi:hypothetical protein